ADADQVPHVETAVDGFGDPCDTVVPAEGFELRDRNADPLDGVCAPEGEVFVERELVGRDRADACARVHGHPSVSPRAMLLPPSSCRLTPVTNSDSRDAR